MAFRPGRPPSTQATAFAARLRALMAERSLSARELARRMGEYLPSKSISPASISHYRTGRIVPRGHSLDALVAALGVEMSELAVPPPVPPRPEHAAGAMQTQAGEEGRQHIGLDDLGDEVRLKFDVRVPGKLLWRSWRHSSVARPSRRAGAAMDH